VDCGFEVDLGGWADWARTVPVLVVHTLAVSLRQLDLHPLVYASLPIVNVQGVDSHGCIDD